MHFYHLLLVTTNKRIMYVSSRTLQFKIERLCCFQNHMSWQMCFWSSPIGGKDINVYPQHFELYPNMNLNCTQFTILLLYLFFIFLTISTSKRMKTCL